MRRQTVLTGLFVSIFVRHSCAMCNVDARHPPIWAHTQELRRVVGAVR